MRSAGVGKSISASLDADANGAPCGRAAVLSRSRCAGSVCEGVSDNTPPIAAGVRDKLSAVSLPQVDLCRIDIFHASVPVQSIPSALYFFRFTRDFVAIITLSWCECVVCRCGENEAQGGGGHEGPDGDLHPVREDR